MIDILRAAKSLNLPDWWICAGFVRTKVWDALHGFKSRTPLPDIDVIYFDNNDISEGKEKYLEKRLLRLYPGAPWSVKNQARMHVINNLPPYANSTEAMSKFTETATAIGVKINQENKLQLAAPCGIQDLLNLKVKPTALFKETIEHVTIYENRIEQKNWQALWPNITILHVEGVSS
ncbi:nucleotidyltransferase family protein [Sutcliffiella horikoshii]|uniref:Nucleotidyltransferase family protein n=1 Tax=Sutcliffiella horikoshii TaxID=79883 RepID=A0A5D4T970_9BACI|nr:nucleotidyltransferase family protein [Sutcliffiella horikoshii]TYS71062.1 nucleotidyltransferase family protein [Sutcliffiella horikoshii]